MKSLKIETYKSAWEGAVKDPELWAPKTRETADHSMLFSVACALADGKVVPDSFTCVSFSYRACQAIHRRIPASILRVCQSAWILPWLAEELDAQISFERNDRELG